MKRNFSRLQLLTPEPEQEIAPTYWSDNYFSLLPGERIIVSGKADKADLGERPVVKASGINVKDNILQ